MKATPTSKTTRIETSVFMNEDNMELEVITRLELATRIEELKAERDERLLKYIHTHPEMSYREIGRKFGLVAEHAHAEIRTSVQEHPVQLGGAA